MSETYDPFGRGPFPVGVRTVDVTDPARARTLPVEVWYPAAAQYAGSDRDPTRWDTYEVLPGAPTAHQEAVRDAEPAPEPGTALVVFSHGLAGHRRQSTFLTTHLASHGYVVVAPDHVGNTLPEVLTVATTAPETLLQGIAQSAEDRPRDIPLLIDAFTQAGDHQVRLAPGAPVGVAGHSFGGWTAIVTTSAKLPVRCALPLAPVGTGRGARLHRDEPYAGVDLAYADRVPTLILAADRDSLCRLENVAHLYAAIGPGHGLMVLHDADHFHFCDRALEVHAWFAAMGETGGVTHSGAYQLAPIETLVGEVPAHDFVRGAGLAHCDAHLRNNTSAAEFLERFATDALAARGAIVTARAAADARV